jgi:hypothetical protein
MEAPSVASDPSGTGNDDRQQTDRLICTAAAVVLIGMFGYLLFQNLHRIRDNDHFSDFRHFYFAAQAMLEHKNPYQSWKGGYVYPPLLAFLYMPLARLSMRHAAQIALTIDVAALFAGLMLASRAMLRRLSPRTPARSVWPVALLAALIVFDKMKAETQMLQTDVFLVLGVGAGLYWLDRRPTVAGLFLAFATNIKYVPIVLLPYLLLRRRWVAAAAYVVFVVAFALLPATWVGLRTDLHYVGSASAGLLRSVGVPAMTDVSARVHGVRELLSVSVTSAVARTCSAARLPENAWPLIIAIVAGACLFGAARMYQRNGLRLFRRKVSEDAPPAPSAGLVALEWACVCAAVLIFGPDTNMRHLVLAIPLCAAAAVLLVYPRPGVSRVPVIIGVVVLIAGFTLPPSKSVRAHDAWFFWGGPCWGLLVMLGTTLWCGLRQVSSIVRNDNATARDAV